MSKLHPGLTLLRTLLISVAASGVAFAEPALRVPESIAIPNEALPAEVERLVQEGLEFESLRRWTDAVTHYEQALREHPKNDRLERRLNLTRLHLSLERRYADESFLRTLRDLNQTSALELHSELLAKIETHYVVTPPWTQLTRNGVLAMYIASRDPQFQQRHRIRPSAAQIESFRQSLSKQLAAKGEIRNAREALRASSEFAQLGQRTLGVPTTAWTLEFVASSVGGLDNYSAFLTPGQLREVYSQIEGNFVGLGVELKADEGALLVVRVIPGSPAEQSGISAGDRITAVDGQQTAELSTERAASLLTGEEGSHVYVTVVSPEPEEDDIAYLVARPIDSATDPVARTLRVRRAHVEVPSIEDDKILDADYGVAYIRIPVFQKSTARDVEAALWSLHREGMRKLVIDLRGNPGGLLTAAVELADKFVSQGNIVSTRGRSAGEDFDYRAHRDGTWRVPLVVLIDGDSASASEIFAAAIRDNRRGTIVGDRSFGKGSVQGIFPLTSSGAGVRLTTAKFFSPLGKPISKVGVAPNVPVAKLPPSEDEQQVVGFRGAGAKKPADRALARAIEVAREQVAMR